MILDSKGRLFGKISILDLGAACVIVLVIIGIFLFPGKTGSIAQVNVATKPVEVDLLVRGLSVKDPETMISQMKEEKKTSLIIRNQPYGNVEILDAEILPRTVPVNQPDGSVKAMTDPRPEVNLVADMTMTLGGKAQILDDGIVLGNQKLKIGTTVELDGYDYNFRASVIQVRVK